MKWLATDFSTWRLSLEFYHLKLMTWNPFPWLVLWIDQWLPVICLTLSVLWREGTRDTLGNMSESERSQPHKRHNAPWTSPPRPAQWQTSRLAGMSQSREHCRCVWDCASVRNNEDGGHCFFYQKIIRFIWGKSCTSAFDHQETRVAHTWNSSNYTSSHYLLYLDFRAF